MSKRKEILKAFKSLQRISQETFNGDQRALFEARQRIQQEFRKKIDEKDIDNKLKVANDVGTILKHQVVQAVKNPEKDNYELKLRKETSKFDNVIFKDDIDLPPPRNKKCGSDAS